MSYDYATNSELREASRDSGVDVNTPGIPETHSTLPKDEKFKIENKNTIPKYKFNQKKQNLRKQIQKVYWKDLLVENNHFLSHHSIIQNYRRLKRGNFQSLVIIANKQAINSQQIKTRIHNLV